MIVGKPSLLGLGFPFFLCPAMVAKNRKIIKTKDFHRKIMKTHYGLLLLLIVGKPSLLGLGFPSFLGPAMAAGHRRPIQVDDLKKHGERVSKAGVQPKLVQPKLI